MLSTLPTTMTNDIVALIDFYEKEKSIDRDKVIAALENAFLSAYRKMVAGADDIEVLRAEIDTKKGGTKIFATLTVVADDDHQDKFNEVPITVAQKVEGWCGVGRQGGVQCDSCQLWPDRSADCQADDDAASPDGGEGDDL